MRVLRLIPTSHKTGLSPSSIYEKMAKGEFPTSIPLGGRRVGWLESELDEWIAARVAERDNARGVQPTADINIQT
jgi:prophage regulatory protein